MVFPVVMWELDYKERWVPKNWCFWTVMLEKTLESPLDCKEIQPVHPKGDQSWVFIGRIDVEPETPILWPPDAKSWLIWKDPHAGKDWGQEEKGTTDNMLSRLVITFLPRSKCLLISWLQSPLAVILEPKKIKSATVSPSICHEVMNRMPWTLFSESWALSQLFHSLSLSSRGSLVLLYFLP